MSLHLGWEELSVWDSRMQFVVEPGSVKVFVGGDYTALIEATVSIL